MKNMANSDKVQVAITQMAIQAATVTVRAMRAAGTTNKWHTRSHNPEEPNRPRQAEPMLSQPAYDW